MNVTAQSEVGELSQVILKGARDAYGDQKFASIQWRDLNYTACPDFGRAVTEYEAFVNSLGDVAIHWLPQNDATTLDSIYVRDASIVCDRGVILCNMGKPARATEPDAQSSSVFDAGIEVIGAIGGHGKLEGGDFFWLTPVTAVVGLGYRTNVEGIAQLETLLADGMDELITVPLPHWKGPADVFHLMSMISPVDTDLAVVYSPLLPVSFREELLRRGIDLVEVPDQEFASQACNVLALGPRRCLMLDGNPITKQRLEQAGADVMTYTGQEISIKGEGGPTCLTRPVTRVCCP